MTSRKNRLKHRDFLRKSVAGAVLAAEAGSFPVPALARSKRRVFAIGAAIMTVLGSTAFAVEPEPLCPQKTIEFEGKEWRLSPGGRATVEEYRGKTALFVAPGYNNFVCLPGVEFQNGTLEIAFAALDHRSPPGIGFRDPDNGHWHDRIIFNRWPGRDQDKSEVVEQAVVTRRHGTLLVLNIRKSGQDSIRERIDEPDWFHVKVVIQGDKVTVYLNGNEEPSIEVGAMFDEDMKGVLGLCGDNFYFANFRYITVE